MSTIVEKIKDIEKEISRTQINKATMSHLCILRAKLAKYRTELLNPPKVGSSTEGSGFDVEKVGDARVALIGFPSVGKSTILSTFTSTKSEAAAYEFTTLTCIPGIIHHKDCRIQLLDLPGIIEGASEGKGRGRQVIGVARSCDLILLVVDAGSGKADRQRELLERELDVVGLRLNQRPPNVYFKRKKDGNVSISSTCQLVNITENDVKQLLHEYKIHSAEVHVHLHLCICICACVHVCMCACVHVCMCARACRARLAPTTQAGRTLTGRGLRHPSILSIHSHARCAR